MPEPEPEPLTEQLGPLLLAQLPIASIFLALRFGRATEEQELLLKINQAYTLLGARRLINYLNQSLPTL